MGRALGAYDEDELDRPDLNKCPDCGCFFATDACTLCGKICPEDMRAGHRAPVKKKKRRNTAGRVQFIPWYHTWPAMIIIAFFMPIAGIILFFTSPYSKKVKIIVGVICIVATLLYTGVGSLLWGMLTAESSAEPPVNAAISRTDYESRCTTMTAEEFASRATLVGTYVHMELTVYDRVADSWMGEENTAAYYRCKGEDGAWVLIRDCLLSGSQTLRTGDMIRVWGESAGMADMHPRYDTTLTYPCLHVAYCAVIG